ASIPLVQLYRCEGGLPLDAGVFVTGDLRIALDVAPGTYMATVAGAPASVTLPADQITLDADAACTASRVPAPLGGPDAASLIVVRRWTSTENHVAFDVDVGADGVMGVAGISSVLGPSNDFYVCPQTCLG